MRPHSTRLSIVVGDRPRTATVVGPQEAPPGRALVVAFHGSRQSGDAHRAFTGYSLDELAAAGEAVVAYPDGYRGNWNDARRESAFPARRAGIDDVGFFRALVGRLAQTHGVDPGRVVVTGFSNGGQFVFRLLYEAPELLAGAAVVGATLPAPESLLAPAGARPGATPFVLVHGIRDPIIRFDGGEPARWVRLAFRIGGRSLSSAETAQVFVDANGIAAPPAAGEILPARTADRRTRVERIASRQPGRAPVTHYIVHGGGHSVPGPKPAPALVGRTSPDLSLADLARELLAPQDTGPQDTRPQDTGVRRSSSS